MWFVELVDEFVKELKDDVKYYFEWEFKDDMKFCGIVIFFLCLIIWPWGMHLNYGMSINAFRQGIPTNFVLPICFFIEIIFSILMVFSIKNNRKERFIKVLFQYTSVFIVFIPFAIEIMEGIHEFADAFAVRNCKVNGAWVCYPSKYTSMDYRQIFHWIASFLPIVLLFAYDLIYLILFRKFENYDNNYDIAKREIFRLNYELEYEKRNSAIYQSFLENNAEDLENYLSNYWTDRKFSDCLKSRFVVLNPKIELLRMGVQTKDEYDYLKKLFSRLNGDIKSYIENFFIKAESAFDKCDKDYESIWSSGMPLIVSDRFCKIPKWYDDYFFSLQSRCKLIYSTNTYIIKNLGSFRILFYGDADKDEENFEYVIVTFDDFKKVAFSNMAYLLYKKYDDIFIVRFKSCVDDIVRNLYDRGMTEITDYRRFEKYEARNILKAKMKKDKK